MTLTVRTRARADADLLEARAWYDEQSPGRGRAFFDAVSALVLRVSDTPLAFPIVEDRTRRALLRRYPYAIYFEVHDDYVLILAVMHTSRDPRRWQGRR